VCAVLRIFYDRQRNLEAGGSKPVVVESAAESRALRLVANTAAA